MPHVKDESSSQPVPGPEIVASGVAASGQGKRKIVKKTVRVVKKVIKKRVPKRVLTSGSENQLVEKAENAVKLNEVTENSNIMNNVIEKSNLVDGVTENTSLVNELTKQSNTTKTNLVDEVAEKTSLDEVMEKSNIADAVMETSKLDTTAPILEPIAGEKGNDVCDINSMEVEAKLNNDAPVSEPLIGGKVDLSCMKEMETSNINITSNDVMTGVDIKDLTVCNPNSVEVEKINYAAGSTTGSEGAKEIVDYTIESAPKDSVLANQNIGIVNKEDVEKVANQDVGPAGDKIVDSIGEKNRSTIGSPKSGEVESKGVGLNEGPLLSGEMAALERKKRRKTEIFVGGLDKDTKEDDIRKVFEVAGKIVEVRLMMNSKTGKNKGFAFVRFATAADAKNALAKYSTVEISGKKCNAAPVEGNDTIFLGNIDRKWKNEDVEELLEKAGIEKIDKVTLKADPNNIDKNRGFAFVELETNKDAQIAFNKLQKKNVFGKNLNIKVAWAQPLIELAEEEMLKVKSVYAEYLPSSWDEEKVKEYFRIFGEIENVVLAKDLPSSRRKDFAFINYTTRDAAVRCIEAISRERLEDHGSKVKMTASLAKPISKSKQMKHVSNLSSKQLLKGNLRAAEAAIKLHDPKNKGKLASSSNARPKVDTSSSTTDELVQILRQQASSNHIPPPQSIAHHFPQPGRKRPFSLVGQDSLYLEPRRLPRGPIESSYKISGPSGSSHGLRMASFPYHHQRGPGLTSESVNEKNMFPSHFQTREQAPYYGNNGIYRRN